MLETVILMEKEVIMEIWIAIIFLVIVIVDVKYQSRIIGNWESWPTVDEYIENHNPTKGKGISCYKCGSHNIWEAGFHKADSDMRLHYCKQCNTYLYRTQRQ